MRGIIEPHERLDISISKNWPDRFSRTEAQRMIAQGMVTLYEKEVIKPSFKAQQKSYFYIKLKKKYQITITANNQNVPILYQDADLVVIHKPTGMTVHPGSGTKEDTLVHSLKSQVHPLSDLNSKERAGIVHRLDRDTEGVMLIAKNNSTHRNLSEQFQKRSIYKEYLAWLSGIPIRCKGEINGFISRNPRNRKLMQFNSEEVTTNSRWASLHYEMLKEQNGFSLVKIVLKTGRTHQIRCSFPHVHAYVVGDRLYSSRKMKRQKIDYDFGLLLVANKICFLHPKQNKKLCFYIDRPKRFLDFERWCSHA